MLYTVTIWRTVAPPFEAQVYWAGRFIDAWGGETPEDAERRAREAIEARGTDFPQRYEQAGAFTVNPNSLRLKDGPDVP